MMASADAGATAWVLLGMLVVVWVGFGYFHIFSRGASRGGNKIIKSVMVTLWGTEISRRVCNFCETKMWAVPLSFFNLAKFIFSLGEGDVVVCGVGGRTTASADAGATARVLLGMLVVCVVGFGYFHICSRGASRCDTNITL